MGLARKSWVVAVAALSVLLLSMGIAVAVVKTQSSPGVTYYGCLHDGTLTKVGTTAPKCTTKGSTVISWNSVGPQGPAGATGATGPPGPAGASGPLIGESVVQGTQQDTINTSGAWVDLPQASLIVTPSVTPATLTVRWWGSVSCFGTGRKYAKVVWNGAPALAYSPLAAYPPVDATQAEIATSVEDSLHVTTAGPETVSIQVETDSGSYCVINPGQWQMTVDTLSS